MIKRLLVNETRGRGAKLGMASDGIKYIANMKIYLNVEMRFEYFFINISRYERLESDR